jgi:hypothetical protein
MSQELEALSEARAQYAQFRKAVELDLARERERRLATENLRIRDLIVHAYAADETIAAIKRAYGTSDHRTIKSVIDSAALEIAAIREAKARSITADGTNVEGYVVSLDDFVIDTPDGRSFEWYFTDDSGELGLETGDFESDGDETLKPLFAAIRNALEGRQA